MLLHERKRATPMIRHQLEEQLVPSNLPRALASIGVRDGMRGRPVCGQPWARRHDTVSIY